MGVGRWNERLRGIWQERHLIVLDKLLFLGGGQAIVPLWIVEVKWQLDWRRLHF